jgi:GNAT superfamily N-acetyltransferase
MVADRSPIPAVSGPPRRPADLTREDVRWLNWHEACTHALVSREVRDLGDGYLLYDETDREPFWNRLGGVAWPRDPTAFDRRLTEMLALFAGLDRIPHVWPAPGFDEPPDLIDRLESFGFEDHGGGMLMAFDPGRAALRTEPLETAVGDPVTVERYHRVSGEAAIAAVRDLADVLLASFNVEPERRVAVEMEALQGLTTDAYHAIVVRVGDRPAAVARRTTFAGASYLSSIGTEPAFRGLGLGALVTSLLVADSLASGSTWIHLGVFEENTVARRLYASLGFEPVGEIAPDLLLTA